MEHYILYNARCSHCTWIAGVIEMQSGGKITPLDLNSDRAQLYLQQVFSAGWRYEPYLLTIKRIGTASGEKISIKGRLGMVLGLLPILGLRGSWRVLSMVRAYNSQQRTIQHYVTHEK